MYRIQKTLINPDRMKLNTEVESFSLGIRFFMGLKGFLNQYTPEEVLPP